MHVKDVKDERMAYMDLLVATLSQHEKTLSNLIERLERMFTYLKGAGREAKERGETKTLAIQEKAPEVVTYLRIEVTRPIEEVTKILETLMKESRP